MSWSKTGDYLALGTGKGTMCIYHRRMNEKVRKCRNRKRCHAFCCIHGGSVGVFWPQGCANLSGASSETCSRPEVVCFGLLFARKPLYVLRLPRNSQARKTLP